MVRIVQRLAIIAAILASIIGYLYYAPNSADIAQVDRIRSIAASMKLVQLIGTAAELFGLSNRVLIARKVGDFVRYVRDKEEEDKGLQIEDTLIENVPIRIARPLNTNENLPAIVYFHGGAFNLGSIETHNRITSTLARSANVVVISVEYRLAPEHPFPAGLDDCYTVAKYILEHGDSKNLRIDQNRVALAGDSAGGNFAAVLAMRFVNHAVGKYSPRLQILIYPALQFFDLMLPSHMKEYYEFFYVSFDHTLSFYFNQTIDKAINANKHTTAEQKKHYRKYVDWSLIPTKYRTIYKHPMTDDHEGHPKLIESAKLALNPEVSPLLVEDEQLAKLPLTYIISVEHDRLRDETFIYEGRLKRVGVPVIHNHYEHIFHGSLGFLDSGPVSLDIACKMMVDLVEYIKKNL